MELNAATLWNLILTVGGAIGMFMLNRVATTLDTLQKADRELYDKVNNLHTQFVPKSEFLIYTDRLENRLESYHSLQMESNKTLFSKIDLVVEKLGEKISRQECIQLMGDRRQTTREQ